jgi:hypothetical protein
VAASSTLTGTLVVGGGAGIQGNLYVGGSATLASGSVNYIQITGNSSGSAPGITSAGGDPNIGIFITTKNQGVIYIGQPSSAATQQIQFNPGGAPGLYVTGNNTNVNYSRFAGAPTGSNPSWIARGGDNAVGLDFATFNTATINFFAGGDYNAGTGLKQISVSSTGTVIFTNTNATSTTTGALIVAGGVGVGGNIYTAGRIGYVSATNVSAVYQYYNTLTNSLDTVFG